MTEDQARKFLRDANDLPEVLGFLWAWAGGNPFDAAGHLAAKYGATGPLPGTDSGGGLGYGMTYPVLCEVYGLTKEQAFHIGGENAGDATNRRAVATASVEEIVRECGFDPDELRGEVPA